MSYIDQHQALELFGIPLRPPGRPQGAQGTRLQIVKIDIKNTVRNVFSRRIRWCRSRVHISYPGGVYGRNTFRKKNVQFSENALFGSAEPVSYHSFVRRRASVRKDYWSRTDKTKQNKHSEILCFSETYFGHKPLRDKSYGDGNGTIGTGRSVGFFCIINIDSERM